MIYIYGIGRVCGLFYEDTLYKKQADYYGKTDWHKIKVN